MHDPRGRVPRRRQARGGADDDVGAEVRQGRSATSRTTGASTTTRTPTTSSDTQHAPAAARGQRQHLARRDRRDRQPPARQHPGFPQNAAHAAIGRPATCSTTLGALSPRIQRIYLYEWDAQTHARQLGHRADLLQRRAARELRRARQDALLVGRPARTARSRWCRRRCTGLGGGGRRHGARRDRGRPAARARPARRRDRRDGATGRDRRELHAGADERRGGPSDADRRPGRRRRPASRRAAAGSS